MIAEEWQALLVSSRLGGKALCFCDCSPGTFCTIARICFRGDFFLLELWRLAGLGVRPSLFLFFLFPHALQRSTAFPPFPTLYSPYRESNSCPFSKNEPLSCLTHVPRFTRDNGARGRLRTALSILRAVRCALHFFTRPFHARTSGIPWAGWYVEEGKDRRGGLGGFLLRHPVRGSIRSCWPGAKVCAPRPAAGAQAQAQAQASSEASPPGTPLRTPATCLRRGRAPRALPIPTVRAVSADFPPIRELAGPGRAVAPAPTPGARVPTR